MKRVFTGFALLAMLAGCMMGTERARVAELYDRYDAHCREHARQIETEKDEEGRYNECMNYFIGTHIDCPYCTVDSHMTKD